MTLRAALVQQLQAQLNRKLFDFKMETDFNRNVSLACEILELQQKIKALK